MSSLRLTVLFWMTLFFDFFLTAFIQLKLECQTTNCLIYYQIIVSKICMMLKLNNGVFMP